MEGAASFSQKDGNLRRLSQQFSETEETTLPLRSVRSEQRPSVAGKEMKDLFRLYKDRQVFELLASDGVQYLGAVTLREGVVMKAFGSENMIWELSDFAEDAAWEALWKRRLQPARASTPHGTCQHWKAEAYVVTLKNAADSWNDGLLYPIVRKLESGACPPSLFSAPVVRAVVWFKWQWARRVICVEFCIFAVWLLAFLVHASAYEPADVGLGFWEAEKEGDSDHAFLAVSLMASFVATVFMLPFSYISTCEVMYNGLKNWLTFWNLFDALAQVCQMLCFVVYFFGIDVASHTYSIMLGTQTVLLVLKIQYFARAVLQVECAFVDNLNEVLREAAVFLTLWLSTVISFAVALYTLFKKDLDLGVNDEIDFYYGTPFHSFFSLFGSMFKRFTYDPLLDSERSVAVTLLFSLFLFLNTVTLYNLIASIVVSSHKKLKKRSQMRLDTGRAQLLIELETATPRRFLTRMQKPYIHLLRLVRPEEISAGHLWNSLGESCHAMESQKEAMSLKLHETEREIHHHIEALAKRIALFKRRQDQ